MTEFLQALANPAIPFLRYALLAGILSSLAFGTVGTYVVVRRISYLAGAIAHCVLGGIGAALYLQNAAGWTWLEPLHGALFASVLAALAIGWVSLRARQREDTVIGAMWAVGMAAGLIFLAKTPGYIDPMSYLFGNILLISSADLWLIAGLDLLVVAVAILFYNKFLAVCFDDVFARVRGIRVEFYYMLLLGLISLTVVLLVSVVGIVMVIALLTLPAAMAGHFSRRLWQMMAIGTVICMLLTSAGLAVSYVHDLPTGGTIIILAGLAYLGVVTFGQGRWLRRNGGRGLRRRRPAE